MKCDERPGQCGNCARLRLVCSSNTASMRLQAPDEMPSRPETSKRKRTYRSCIGCRTSKTKCSGERPTCQRCTRKDLDCVYSESCQPNWIQRVEAINNDSQTGMPTPTVLSNGSPINNVSIQASVSYPASQSSCLSPAGQKSSLEW